MSSALSPPARISLIAATDCLPKIPTLSLRDLPNDVRKWPIGDALAVGQAPSVRDNYLARKISGEFHNKPRFSYPRVAQHGQQVAGSITDQVTKNGVDHRTLALASDKRRLEAAFNAGGAGDNAYHNNGRELLAVLERARATRLYNNGVAYQLMGCLSNQDFVGRRGLLETLGNTHSLAGEKSMSLSVDASKDLPGVEANPMSQLDAPNRLKLDG